MKKVSAALVGAMCLLLSACNSGSDDSDRTTTQEQAQTTDHKMGEMVEGNGVGLKIDKAYVSKTYEQDAENSVDSPLETVTARDKGKFLVIETTVRNDSEEDMDLTCSAPISIKLETDKDAKYGPVESLYKLPGNPECNDQLGPDFDTKMTWIFEFQESHKPERIAFAAMAESMKSGIEEFSYIALDKLSNKEPASSENNGPNPTSAASATAGNSDSVAETQAPAAQAEPQDSQQQEQAQANTAPALGATCGTAQILQPAVTADGTNVVCVGMGANAPARWVQGPAPSGQTVDDGQTCSEGEEGGQDAQGRMLMCVGGQWVYGP